MDNQIIISVAREFGAGGHQIADILSEKYKLPVYDRDMLDHIAAEKGINLKELKKYDEMPRNIFLSRSVSGFSNSPQDIVAQMEFDFLRQQADSGKSFIVVGRCANIILKDNPNHIRIFVTSDENAKINRIKELYHISEIEAKRMIVIRTKNRKKFHNRHCKEKWGDSRYYDLTISTAKIGIEKASEVIDNFITAQISI